jgi:hypothetical protein
MGSVDFLDQTAAAQLRQLHLNMRKSSDFSMMVSLDWEGSYQVTNSQYLHQSIDTNDSVV